ncbi:MAG: hypothetical protein V3V95_07110, partial [Thermodesulfobacteriota bacterium]
MRKFIFHAFLLSSILLFTSIMTTESNAMPMFAKRIGRDCSYCHVAFPKLNETGRIFKANGFRFAEEEEWEDIKDMGALPLAMEIEVEGEFNRTKSAGVTTEESDMKVEEVEIMGAAALGKDGKVSVLGVVGVEDGSAFAHGYIQINDLYGPRGEGLLNLKTGEYEVALPFLANSDRIIKNGYFAEKTLDVFSTDQLTVELNGSKVGEEETSEATHRYAVGITREDVNSDNKFKGFFASYSVTYWEKYNVGAIYRRGEEMDGMGGDRSTSRYGLAGEAEYGPVLFTLGLFRAERSGLEDLDNILLEGLWFPLEDLILGARVDILMEDGSKDALALSLTARYNILINVFAQVELRTLE